MKSDFEVIIGQLDTGRWVAATDESPYFCLTGESESAVTEKARAALRFYCRVSIVHNDGGLRQRHSEKLHSRKRIRARDLAA